MNRFIKIKDKVNPERAYWFLDIKTIDELINFLNFRSGIISANYLELKEADFINVDSNLITSDNKSRHMQTDLWFSALILSDPDKPKAKSFIDDVLYLQNKSIGGYVKLFNEFGHIRVNKNYGFCHVLPNDDSEILETIETETFIFPDENKNYEPRYIQWQNGKHWYVKIGNQDVVVNDCQKWNTKEEAEKAYQLYLKENNLY